MAEDTGVWVKVWPDFTGGAPGAAVIGGATGAVTESSFTGDGTNGDDGQAYDVYEFTGSGELLVTDAGMLEIVAVAGGGGAGSGASGEYGGCGGGAGGMLETQLFAEAHNLPIVVGGAGSNAASGTRKAGTNGNDSQVGLKGITAVGGGYGSGNENGTGNERRGSRGGSAGGQYVGGAITGTAGQGGSSSVPNYINGACGGGAGGDAVTGTGQDLGSGGPGRTTLITGSPVEYSRGGAGGAQPKPGTGQKGNGGSSEYASDNQFESPQDGEVVVRVKVPTESYPFRTKTTAPRTAHAARIEDGIVRQVIVIPHLDDDDKKITEYCNRIGLPGTWVDTSYTGARRGKYAGVGDTFVGTKAGGEFISPIIEEVEA